MMPTIPPLPAGTAFRLDQDEFQQPRLRWGGTSLIRRCFQVAMALMVQAFFLRDLYSNELVYWLFGWACVTTVWATLGLIIIMDAWQNRLLGLARRCIMAAAMFSVFAGASALLFLNLLPVLDSSLCMSSVWILSGVILIVASTGVQTSSGNSVVTFIYPGREAWLVLAEAWLLYDRGGNHYRGVWQFDRWKQKEVRLEPGKVGNDCWSTTASIPLKSARA